MEPDIDMDDSGHVKKRPANYCSVNDIQKKKAKYIINNKKKAMNTSVLPEWMQYQEWLQPDQSIVKERCVWFKKKMVAIGKSNF